MSLHIPNVTPDDDILSAALKYAAAGWYVGPLHPEHRKNPGKILGNGWQSKTSRDRDQIVAWFTGTPHLLFGHCGRSGAWIADVDHPEHVPAVLVEAIRAQSPPHQSSRPDQLGRGHYPFLMPTGRMIGNSTGQLGKAWGEGRGRNGIIALTPSPHQAEADGALYRWLRTGSVPDMTAELAAALPDAGAVGDAATDAEVQRFAATHTGNTSPGTMQGPLTKFGDLVTAGGSRHGALVEVAPWAAREAMTGRFPASAVFERLTAAFTAAMAAPRSSADRRISSASARAEAHGVIAWAVAQAELEGVESARARIAASNARGFDDLCDPPTVIPATTPTPATSGAPWQPAAAPGPEEAPPSEPASTYLPLDLGAYLDGSHVPPTAGLLHRTDGVGLLYPGKVHWIYGEPESGKSLVCQYVAASVLLDGGTVLYLDHESDPPDVIERIRAFGVPDDVIKARFRYVKPETSPRADPAGFAALLTGTYDLAVLDGVNEALALAQVESKDNDGLTAWIRTVLRAITAHTGAAVLAVDHVTKTVDGSAARFPIGGQAKLAATDGAAYLVDVVRSLGRGVIGEVKLRNTKDRAGSIKPRCGPGVRIRTAANIVFDSTEPGRIHVSVEPPQSVTAAPGEAAPVFRPTVLMERVSRLLEDHPSGMTSTEVFTAAKGRKEHLRSALTVLVAEGFAVRSEHRRGSAISYTHRSVRLFRELDDLVAAAGPGEAAVDQDSGRTPSTGSRVPPIEGGTRGTRWDSSGVTGFGDPVGPGGDPVGPAETSGPGEPIKIHPAGSQDQGPGEHRGDQQLMPSSAPTTHRGDAA